MLSLYCIVFFCYTVTILVLAYGFDALKKPQLPLKQNITTFSVIIPFKDEAQNLPHLFQSISHLNYPSGLVEFILINDHSEDSSVELVNAFILKSSLNIKLIHSSSESFSPKKEALTTAINQASKEWILTTDTDCSFGTNWLRSYDAFIQQHAVQFVAGPVAYKNSKSFFHLFQQLDFSSLIGVTIGSFGLNNPLMCNGANLAFKKTFFKTLNGYEGNETIASGDDVFLLEKAVNTNPNQVAYIKHECALVLTQPVNTLKQLVAQRVRWASKTSKSLSIKPKLLGLLVLSTNGLCIVSCLQIFTPLLPVRALIFCVSLKILVDGLLLYKTLRFFNQLNALRFYWLSALIYPFFSVYVAILSLFGGYKWKNRSYKT